MGACDVLEGLRADGLTLQLTPHGLSVSPRREVTEGHRAAIRGHRTLLIEELEGERRLLGQLVASIERCCDVRGDDDANREALLRKCEDLPPKESLNKSTDHAASSLSR